VGNYRQYYAKRIFTVPNLMDPGVGFVFDNVSSKLFRTNKDPYTSYKFNYQKFTFNFGKYFTVTIGPNDRGTAFECLLNGKKITIGTTKSTAAKSTKGIDKLAKTFGDFLQILINSALYKGGKNVVSATSDGNFVGMLGFVQRELFNISPRIIVDRTSTLGSFNKSIDGIFIFGLDDQLNRTSSDKVSNSRATTKVDGKEVVSNTNSRQRNVTPSSKNNSQQRKTTDSNSNAMSVAGSSSGSVYTNNNGKNIQSKPTNAPGKPKKLNNNNENKNMRPTKRRQVNPIPIKRQRVVTPKPINAPEKRKRMNNNNENKNMRSTNRPRVATPNPPTNRPRVATPNPPTNRPRMATPIQMNNGRNISRVTRAGTPFATPRILNTPKTSGINMFGMRKEPNLPQGKLNMFGMRR